MSKAVFSLGADPEYFLQKEGEFVAAPSYVKGTKERPEMLLNGGGLQYDNVAIEVAIPYAMSRIQFIKNVANAYVDMRAYLPKDINIVAIPSAFFPVNQLKHPATQEFGCSPDLNAWTRSENIPPEGCGIKTFRSCGGHLHVGYINNSGLDFLKEKEGKVQTIRMMDALHGILSTVLDSSEAAIDRRVLYGKAGCFRPTTYGVEYRTLSNFWVKHPILVGLMWHLTEDMLSYMKCGKYKELLIRMGHDDIQQIINAGDSKGAEWMIEQYIADVLSDDTQNAFIIAEEILSNERN